MPSLVRGGGHGHRIRKERDDEYVVSWRVDRKIGRLRAETWQRRDTDRAGALRFAKKWGCRMPDEAP